MKRARLTASLLLVVALGAGCRSNFGLNARTTPVAPNLPFDVKDVVASHNRDAMRVTSYEADPAVTFQPGRARSRLLPGGVVRGKVFAEPGTRNFRLVLNTPPMKKERFDIGSNNERFWLWSPDTFGNDDVYTCNYDESGAVPLSALYQPDWLMEAMGLAPLPEPGQPGVSVRNEDGDAIIEQRRQGADGALALKETVISGVNRRVAEHRLYQIDPSGRKDLAARAIVKTYERFPIAGAGGESSPLELPASFQLIWPTEQVDLTVQFQSVKLNAGFERAQHKMLFTLPEKRGSRQQDLRAAVGSPSDAPVSVRETLPAPPANVHLSEPIPAAANDTPARDREATTRRVARVQRAFVEPEAVPVAPRSSEPLLGDGPPRPPGEAPTMVVRPDWRVGRD